MIRDRLFQKIKFYLVILVIAIVIAFAIFTVMKYEVEGEKIVPFKLGKVIVISSAVTTQANQNEENYLWNERVIQNNDVYIYLDKDLDYKDEQIIRSVKIENIQILQNVKLGKVQVYMPNSMEDSIYKYTDEYLVNSSLTYTGAIADNKKTLEIANQGGCICISFANVGIGEYKSNDDEQIEQGAFILEKMNIANEDLKFRVSFDLVIEVEDKSYKANMVLDCPVDGVVGQQETHKEITDLNNIVFKRL